MTKNKKGRLIVISAPSGAGKGTVLKRVLEIRPDLHLSVSATTRAPRVGEVDGTAYYFVQREKFKEMISAGEFLEHAEFIGEHYGTLKNPVYELIDNGKVVLLEIEVQGAKQVMTMQPDAVSIFIVPPDLDELERRLRGRGTDDEDKLIKRLERAKVELEERHGYTHVVINDDATRAAEEILTIIDSI